MTIDYPTPEQLTQLRQLWQEAFHDSDSFLDSFFSTAFAPDRCRCICLDGQVAAALYWMDCRHQGRPVAYLYAVATARHHQRKGLCRQLMTDTKVHLASLGYQGLLLVPGSRELAEMYQNLGWRYCCFHQSLPVTAGGPAVPLQPVDPSRYGTLRKALLPPEAVEQDSSALAFLATQAQLYAGDGFVLAATAECDGLLALEYLGDTALAPGILRTLGKPRGQFRIPGRGTPFAMYLDLADEAAPEYFAFAFE